MTPSQIILAFAVCAVCLPIVLVWVLWTAANYNEILRRGKDEEPPLNSVRPGEAAGGHQRSQERKGHEKNW